MLREMHKREAYVVDDQSMVATPAQWAAHVVKLAAQHDATVVVETNQGGAMAKLIINQTARELALPVPTVREVWATGSKMARAEPIGSAYERGRIHHVNILPEYESQLTEWVEKESGYSPDRMDAGVWALTSLLIPQATKGGVPGTARALSPNRLRRTLGVAKGY